MHTHVKTVCLVPPIYNAHPYFSLKNLGKKSVRYTQQTMVFL